jgi:CheY-like chemotaxis protein
MRILIVEDDYMDVESLQSGLRDKLDATVDVISTESEFCAKFDQVAGDPPDFVVLDVMLRWTDPTPDLNVEDIPAEVRRDGFYLAGVRCHTKLQSDPRTKNIPVAFYTTLERNEFGLSVVHITKEEEIDALVRVIRSKLSH